jgi:hypothetical protein
MALHCNPMLSSDISETLLQVLAQKKLRANLECNSQSIPLVQLSYNITLGG